MYILSLKERLVALSSRCFKEYTSAERSAIHDCYISGYDTETSQLDLLQLEMGMDTVSGLHNVADDQQYATLPIILGTSRDCAPGEFSMDKKPFTAIKICFVFTFIMTVW